MTPVPSFGTRREPLSIPQPTPSAYGFWTIQPRTSGPPGSALVEPENAAQGLLGFLPGHGADRPLLSGPRLAGLGQFALPGQPVLRNGVWLDPHCDVAVPGHARPRADQLADDH